MNSRRKILFVGASGMLSDAAVTLAARGDELVIFARNEAKLTALVDRTQSLPGSIHWSSLDYRDVDLLRSTTRQWINALGAFDCVIAWIHSTAPAAPMLIARLCVAANARLDFLHVLGSSHVDPSKTRADTRGAFDAMGITYREAILGFITERGGRSRWLTHSEISDGVIAALDSTAPKTIIGQVEPWELRP